MNLGAEASTASNVSLLVGSRLRIALLLIAALLLPHLTPYLARHSLVSGRALVNLDFLLVPAICAAFGSRWGATCYVVLCLVDAVEFLAPIYHLDFLHFLLYLRYSPQLTLDLSALPLMQISCFIVITLGGAVLTLRAGRHVDRKMGLIFVAVAALLGITDACGGPSNASRHFRASQPDLTLLQMNVATSGSYRLQLDVEKMWQAREVRPWLPAPSGIGAALGPGLDGASTRVVGRNLALIIVESWGEPIEPHAAAAQLHQLLSPEVSNRFEVRRGTVPFWGGTTAGELRELCGVRYNYEWLQLGQSRTRCLPEILSARGFGVTGWHGFFGSFFNRDEWWPIVGIKDRRFLDTNNEVPKRPLCGYVFRGICDADLIARMGEEMAKPGRHFGYVLTLNSHVPLPIPDNISNAPENGIPVRPAVRAMTRQLDKVFEAIALQAMRPELADTQFVIVGDHAPPFVDAAAARAYRGDVVPYIELRPRTAKGGIDMHTDSTSKHSAATVASTIPH